MPAAIYNGLAAPDALLAIAVAPEYAVATYVKLPPPVLAGAINETLTPVGALEGCSAALTLVGAPDLV